MSERCPECGEGHWANDGDGFYCIACGYPDREWYLYPEEEDEEWDDIDVWEGELLW